MFNFLKLLVSKVLKKARLSSLQQSTLHPESNIQSGSSFYFSEMDRFSFCGYDCDIYNVKIGAFTSIASNVVIGGARHPMEWGGMSSVFYSGRDSLKIKFSKHLLNLPPKTVIGNDVWIGRSAIIMSGVHIANGSVVGAGSVVTKNVPPYAIVAGNPAKIIRYRFEDQLIKDFMEINWWDLSKENLEKVSAHIRNPYDFINAVRNL